MLIPHRVRAIHPDVFLCGLLDEETEGFLDAVRQHRGSLARPPKTAQDYMQTLVRHGLPMLTERLRRREAET